MASTGSGMTSAEAPSVVTDAKLTLLLCIHASGGQPGATPSGGHGATPSSSGTSSDRSTVEIIDHVWESPGASDLNVVEVYIGYLRRKVDAPFGRRSIVTVRGSGYRLAGDGG